MSAAGADVEDIPGFARDQTTLKSKTDFSASLQFVRAVVTQP
jgi:hypothetical protein